MQQSDRTVYVGNVGKEVDDAALMALFGHCGTVRVLTVVRKMLCVVQYCSECWTACVNNRGAHTNTRCFRRRDRFLLETAEDVIYNLQVTQIRIAGDPSYDTRYAFIEFTTPEEVCMS